MNYTFTYYKCQSCSAKVNCKSCAKEIEDDLLSKGYVKSIEINMLGKTMELELAERSENDVLDYLDAVGVMV